MLDLRTREQLIRRLRDPGREADLLLAQYLVDASLAEAEVAPYTSRVESALTLLPATLHWLCGRSEDGQWYWCDVGMQPQVQAWGRTPAAAIAAAAFAYFTHPVVQKSPQQSLH